MTVDRRGRPAISPKKYHWAAEPMPMLMPTAAAMCVQYAKHHSLSLFMAEVAVLRQGKY